MTDRELIEAAAKAAGVYLAPEWRGHHKHLPGWNPLEDDGDALRLAIELRIEVGFSGFRVWAVQPYKNARAEETETMGYSVEEATRRAIVRAAAAIGKEMP